MKENNFSHAAIFLAVIVVILIGNSPIRSQLNGQGAIPGGWANGRVSGSYHFSDIENINLFNGRLNISLPLAGARDRGATSFPVNLTIQSPIWRTEKHPHPNPNVGTPAIFAIPDQSWEIGAVPKVEVRFSYDLADPQTCFPQVVYDWTLTRLYVTLPDGTEIELRDATYDGEKKLRTGCFSYANRGTTFVSKDGTFMRFVADADVEDGPGNNDIAGTLYLRDGTAFRFDDAEMPPESITDRNGNISNFSFTNFTNGYDITDSVGRVVSVDRSLFDYVAGIKFKGSGGNEREIAIGGSTLGDSLDTGEVLESQNELFDGAIEDYGGGSSDFNPSVISDITLPDGRAYQFKYNRYGEVTRIVFPTGSVVEYDFDDGVINSGNGGYVDLSYDSAFTDALSRGGSMRMVRT